MNENEWLIDVLWAKASSNNHSMFTHQQWLFILYELKRASIMQEPVVKINEDTIITNVPNKIYLNLGEMCGLDGCIDFNDLTGVTWCGEMIDDTDIEYIRGAK
jgi:hypothetical protein